MTIHRSFTGNWYVLNKFGDTVFRGTWDQCIAYSDKPEKVNRDGVRPDGPKLPEGV